MSLVGHNSPSDPEMSKDQCHHRCLLFPTGKMYWASVYQYLIVIKYWGLKVPWAENSTGFLGVVPNLDYVCDKRTKPQLTLFDRSVITSWSLQGKTSCSSSTHQETAALGLNQLT